MRWQDSWWTRNTREKIPIETTNPEEIKNDKKSKRNNSLRELEREWRKKPENPKEKKRSQKIQEKRTDISDVEIQHTDAKNTWRKWTRKTSIWIQCLSGTGWQQPTRTQGTVCRVPSVYSTSHTKARYWAASKCMRISEVTQMKNTEPRSLK